MGSLSTFSLSGGVEAVCAPQTTPGKPDLYSGPDFFCNSSYRAVLDILAAPFLSMFVVVSCCKSNVEGVLINSLYQQVRGMGSRCTRVIQNVVISVFAILLIAFIGNIRLLAAWTTAPIGACYHAGNFVMRLALVQGYRLNASRLAAQDAHLTGNDDYDAFRRTMSHQDWSSLRRDNARKRSGPPRPTIWNWPRVDGKYVGSLKG